jgi:hypothetical protein
MHMPKTGGAALKRSLIARFGEKRCILDQGPPQLQKMRAHRPRLRYWTALINGHVEMCGPGPEDDGWVEKRVRTYERHFRRVAEAQDIQVVAGHGDYGRLSWLIPDDKTFVFFRDPVERVISQYHHQCRKENVAPGVSVLEWASESPMRANVQSRIVKGLDLDKAFVGITERYEESVSRLNDRWPHLRLEIVEANVNPDKTIRAHYALEPEVRAELERLNADDSALYERALKRYV